MIKYTINLKCGRRGSSDTHTHTLLFQRQAGKSSDFTFMTLSRRTRQPLSQARTTPGADKPETDPLSTFAAHFCMAFIALNSIDPQFQET
jgi:hypothetical protein